MARRRRPIQLHFMVDERERDLVLQKMEQAGTRNMGAYLRKMAIDGVVVKLDLTDVRQLVKLLRNATDNLNQIARRANSTGSIYAEDVEDLQAHYDKLWDAAKQVLAGLAKIQ